MALNLIHRLLESVRARTQEERVREDRLHQEQTAERRERREKDDADESIDFLLIAEATRQAIEELSHEIEDAMQAVRLAYERALLEQKAAIEALDAARENAITLPDGRRVYFSATGKLLYGEERQPITDDDTIAEAQSALVARPAATTFEAYAAFYDRAQTSAERLDRLGSTLDRLDDIQTRLNSGKVAAEELTRLHEQTRDIIDALPTDARSDYEALKEVRQGVRPIAYRALDPDLEADFALKPNYTSADASAANPSTDNNPEAVADRRPAYKSAPEL